MIDQNEKYKDVYELIRRQIILYETIAQEFV